MLTEGISCAYAARGTDLISEVNATRDAVCLAGSVKLVKKMHYLQLERQLTARILCKCQDFWENRTCIPLHEKDLQKCINDIYLTSQTVNSTLTSARLALVKTASVDGISPIALAASQPTDSSSKSRYSRSTKVITRECLRTSNAFVI